MRPASTLALKVMSATGIGALAVFGAGGGLAGASPGGMARAPGHRRRIHSG